MLKIFYSLINVLPQIKTKTIIILLFILFFICAALYVQLFGLNTSAYKLIDSFFILSNTQLFILKKFILFLNWFIIGLYTYTYLLSTNLKNKIDNLSLFECILISFIFFFILNLIALFFEYYLLSVHDISKNVIDFVVNNNTFGNHFINGDSISSFFENLSNFISHLTFEQLLAVAHISSSIFIFILLFNIISVIYSDFLLNYLKIEEKYPKLGRIIKIRRMYQQYYLILNILLIIITLMATIFINYHIFITFA